MEKVKEKETKETAKRGLLAMAVGGLAVIAAGIGLVHIAKGLGRFNKH